MFVRFLGGLTRDAEALRVLKGRDLYARWALEGISSPVYSQLLQHPAQCRAFSRDVLRSLALDWKELPLSPLRRLAGSGAFYSLYALTWLKTKLWPTRGDIRAIIGLHLLLLR